MRDINIPESSNIAAVHYDDDKQTLVIDFKGGGSYEYKDVPKSVAEQFEKEPSAGKYFYKAIRLGGYEYRKV